MSGNGKDNTIMMTNEEICQYWEEHRQLPYPLERDEIIRFFGSHLPPYDKKVATVREYRAHYHINTLVETGTYHGEMVEAMLGKAQRIISIELQPQFYEAAKQKFSANPSVTILNGDSSKVIPHVLSTLSEPSLFWLDGHYDPFDTQTARGEMDTPVLQELEHILSHKITNHIILIDDARCFIGPNPIMNHYPTIPELEQFVMQRRRDVQFSVKDDIIRIVPK